MKNKLKMILLALFFVICITSIGFASENQDDLSSEKYEVSEETAENYIDSQLDKININELQEYIKDDDVFKNIDLKVFVKDLIKGDAKISDLINVENLKSSILAQLSTSLKVIIMIIVLALLSSILKSLENSFSSGDVAKIVNYIIFITMVTLVLINFKDVLEISYNTVDRIIGVVNVLAPILLSLIAIGGLVVTSSTLSPVFIGGISVINIIFKIIF